MKSFIKFVITIALLFGPFIIAIAYDAWQILGLYIPSIWLLLQMYTDVRSDVYTKTKKFIPIALILMSLSLASNAQYQGKMYQRALPEHTISMSVHPLSKGFGIMYDQMIFSTRSMIYATIAADNFGVENSTATWPEHLSASIGLEWCSPAPAPKDPQLRVGFGIKYSSLHTVNGCQSATIDLSDIRPEAKIAIRIERWFTMGVRIDLWEANSAVDVGISF
jgi:hypothetical protein